MPAQAKDEDIRIAKTYGPVIAFPISRKEIPSCQHGQVLEVTISRVSTSAKYPIYLAYNASARRIFVSLAQVGPAEGESFRIQRMRVYSLEEVVLDYQRKKPKGLEDTRLSRRGDALMMSLPGFSFELLQARLRTVRGMLMVDAELPKGEGEIVVSKKLDQFAIGLKGEEKSPITSMLFEKGFLLLTYQTTHNPFPHLRRIPTSLWRESSSQPNGNHQALNESGAEKPDFMTTREIRG